MIEVDEKTISGFINDSEINLVKFGAAWCGNCKAQEQLFDTVYDEYSEIWTGHTVSFLSVYIGKDEELGVHYENWKPGEIKTIDGYLRLCLKITTTYEIKSIYTL
jgi:thiol-disulfide isomerase/thioredoxin